MEQPRVVIIGGTAKGAAASPLLIDHSFNFLHAY
jgi:hypothetical protein